MKPGWPATGWQWVRFAGNFVNLSTPVGLAVARIGSATIRRGPRGLFLGEGYRFRFPIAGAFTIGNVITTSSTWDTMSRRCPYLIQHEEGHTWQYCPTTSPTSCSWAGRCCVPGIGRHGTSSSVKPGWLPAVMSTIR